MDFNAKVENGCTIVSLAGRLDTVTAPECDRKFRALATENIRVVLDLAGLDYISSAGLRSILMMAKLMKEKNGRISLANLKHNVRTVFDLSGFESIFPIRDSVAEGITAIL